MCMYQVDPAPAHLLDEARELGELEQPVLVGVVLADELLRVEQVGELS